MKTRVRFSFTLASLLLAITLLLHPGKVQAQGNNPLVTADENGTGSILFPGFPATPMPGVLAADPGPGGQSSALTYNLLGPPGLVSGDLHIFDIGAGSFTDLIRFNPAGTGSAGYPASLVFYSVVGGGALGDTGLPSGAYTNIVSLFETAAGDIFYTPGSAQPGFVPGFSVSYHFISSAPEGGSTLLLLLAAATVLFLLQRRHARAKV